MAFLNPLVLIGLVAAAIPLLVHFFNFRQPHRLDYSSLALLHALKRTTIQRMRIRQWLLLILRTLSICALIAAFARPVLTGATGGELLGRTQLSIAFVIDNSLSMTQGNAEGTYLEQVLTSARTLMQESAGSGELFLLASSESFPIRTEDLSRIQASDVTVTAAEAIQRAALHLQEAATHSDKVVIYMGDLQESTLADSLHRPVADDISVRLIPVRAASHPNVSITKAVVQSRIIELGEPIRIEGTAINHSTTLVEDWAVSLYLESERVAQSGVSLLPGVPTSFTLTASPPSTGWLSGYIEGEDDSFYHDNRHYFTLLVPRTQDILIVRGPGSQTDNLELALSLYDGQGSFRPLVISAEDLTATALTRYDAIFLVGLETLSSGELAELTRFIEQGGGVMVFPAYELSATNLLLDALGAGNWHIEESTQTVTDVAYGHTLFEGVFDSPTPGDSRQVEPVQVYRIAAYTQGTALEQPLIRLSGGTPFLQEIRHGQGHVLLMAVPPDNQWSDFPVRGLFVPLLYRAAYYLAAGESVQGDQLIAGQSSTVRLRASSELAFLTAPSGVESVPEQRQAFGATLLDLQVDEPGIAAISAGGEILRRLSVSLDARESLLSYATPEQAAEALSSTLGVQVNVLDDENLEAAPGTIADARRGLSLWRHFLIAALVLLTAEMLVAMRWRAE